MSGWTFERTEGAAMPLFYARVDAMKTYWSVIFKIHTKILTHFFNYFNMLAISCGKVDFLERKDTGRLWMLGGRQRAPELGVVW